MSDDRGDEFRLDPGLLRPRDEPTAEGMEVHAGAPLSLDNVVHADEAAIIGEVVRRLEGTLPHGSSLPHRRPFGEDVVFRTFTAAALGDDRRQSRMDWDVAGVGLLLARLKEDHAVVRISDLEIDDRIEPGPGQGPDHHQVAHVRRGGPREQLGDLGVREGPLLLAGLRRGLPERDAHPWVRGRGVGHGCQVCPERREARQVFIAGRRRNACEGGQPLGEGVRAQRGDPLDLWFDVLGSQPFQEQFQRSRIVGLRPNLDLRLRHVGRVEILKRNPAVVGDAAEASGLGYGRRQRLPAEFRPALVERRQDDFFRSPAPDLRRAGCDDAVVLVPLRLGRVAVARLPGSFRQLHRLLRRRLPCASCLRQRLGDPRLEPRDVGALQKVGRPKGVGAEVMPQLRLPDDLPRGRRHVHRDPPVATMLFEEGLRPLRNPRHPHPDDVDKTQVRPMHRPKKPRKDKEIVSSEWVKRILGSSPLSSTTFLLLGKSEWQQ